MNLDNVEYISMDANNNFILNPSGAILGTYSFDINKLLHEHADTWMQIEQKWIRCKDFIIMYNKDDNVICRTKYFDEEIKEIDCAPCYVESTAVNNESLRYMRYKCDLVIIANEFNNIELKDDGILINDELIELYADRVNRAEMIKKLYDSFAI